LAPTARPAGAAPKVKATKAQAFCAAKTCRYFSSMARPTLPRFVIGGAEREDEGIAGPRGALRPNAVRPHNALNNLPRSAFCRMQIEDSKSKSVKIAV
jgi:hypothetical protein